MFDRRTPELDERLCAGLWTYPQLLEMDLKFRQAVERAFACKAESGEAARATVVRKRVTEEQLIQRAWEWFVRRNRDTDVAFSEVLVHCPGIHRDRVEAAFRQRFAANPQASSA
jgi:hypothetical protein